MTFFGYLIWGVTGLFALVSVLGLGIELANWCREMKEEKHKRGEHGDSV